MRASVAHTRLLSMSARVTMIAPEEIAPDIAERFEKTVALRAVRCRCPSGRASGRSTGATFKVSRDVA